MRSQTLAVAVHRPKITRPLVQSGNALMSVTKTAFEDNFQKTSLVYHMNTGLLFSAEIAIGGFILSFDIKSLDPSFTTSSSSSTLNFNSIIYFNIFVIAFYTLRTKLH